MRTGRLAVAGGSRWLRHIAYGFDDHDKRAYPELAATNERINERTSENVRVLSVRKLLLVDERPNCDLAAAAAGGAGAGGTSHTDSTIMISVPNRNSRRRTNE